MKTIIIYASKYGSSKDYTKTLSEKLKVDCLEYSKVKTSEKCDFLIYVGPLYAGGIVGLSKTLKRFSAHELKKLFIITVGISDPKNTKNVESIRNSVYKQVPKEFYNILEIFHVRGRLNYSNLSLKDNILLKLLHHSVKKIPERERDEETKTFLATYKQKVDFVDFNSLDVVVKRYYELVETSNFF